MRPIRSSIAAAVCFALTATPAASQIADSWPLLGFARDGSCELSINGNGKTMLIAAKGLLPGERARMLLTNGDMKPLDWRVLSNRDGAWSQFYIPFRWHRDGGTVAVSVEGSTCSLSASASWNRAIRVIP